MHQVHFEVSASWAATAAYFDGTGALESANLRQEQHLPLNAKRRTREAEESVQGYYGYLQFENLWFTGIPVNIYCEEKEASAVASGEQLFQRSITEVLGPSVESLSAFLHY